MKKILVLLLSSFLMFGVMSAKVVKDYESHPSGDGLNLRIDSIDFRKDLTRVYGTLLGIPHTSNRIDAVTFDGIQCTDIDGVDFNRYFQWEEEGEIPVELDFPRMKCNRNGSIELQTPRGKSAIVFSQTAK